MFDNNMIAIVSLANDERAGVGAIEITAVPNIDTELDFAASNQNITSLRLAPLCKNYMGGN